MMIRPAASISARCENAWGKLPRWRPVLLSYVRAAAITAGGTHAARPVRLTAATTVSTFVRYPVDA